MPPKYASRWQNLGSNSGNIKEYRVVKSDILEYNGGKWKDITLVERPNQDGTIGTKGTSGLAFKGNTVFDRNPEINDIVNSTVLGIGTNEPFSRISLGSNKGDGIFDNAKTMGGQNAAIAIHENSDGKDFKGFVYDEQVEAQVQPSNDLMLTKALGIFSNVSTTNFSLLDHNILENEDGSLLKREKLGGRLYLTEDDRVIVGGKPRIGLESGSDLLTNYDEIKVKLDVRGSIRTQGYINFLNYSSNDPLSNSGGYDGWLRDVDNKANYASRNNDPTSPNVENIPRGSIWLGLDRDFIPDENTTISSNQPSLYFKDSNGSIQKIQTKQDAGDKLFAGKISSINETQTFGFIYNTSTENTNPVRITLSGERFDVNLETETDPPYFKNALTIRTGNVAITGVHGSNNEIKTSLNEELQIKPYFLKSDLIGGKFWVERQEGIGPNQYDKLYSMLNIETLEKIPALVSCKTWNTYAYQKATFKEIGESLIVEIEYNIPLDDDGNPDLTVDELANKILEVGLKFQINQIPNNNIAKLIEGNHFISEFSQSDPTFQFQLTADIVFVVDDSINIEDDEDYFIIPVEREIVNGELILPYNQYDVINLLGVLPDNLRNGIHYIDQVDTTNNTIKILKKYTDFEFIIEEQFKKLKIFDFNFKPPDATNSIILIDETDNNQSQLESTINNINARNCFMFGSIHDVNIKNSIIGGSVKNTVEGEGDCLILGGGNIIANANNLTVIGNNNQVPDRLFSDLRLVVGDNNTVFYVDSNANASVGGNLDVLGVADKGAGQGNLDVRGDGLIRQNLTVNGNFTVKGTTTTLDTVNTTIEDNIIELARNTTNPASAKDSGILIQRGGNNAFMGFCEQEDKFVMCMTNANGDFNGNYISKEAATLNVFKLEFSNAEGTKLSIQDKITNPSQYYLTVNKNSDGYVGIGNNDPSCLLTIGSTAGGIADSMGGVLCIRQKGNTVADGIALTSTSSNSTRMFKSANGNFHLYNTGGGDDDYFTFQNGNGYVGIGTQNPLHKLQVHNGVLNINGFTEPDVFTNQSGFFWHQYLVGPTISGYKFQVRIGNTEKNGTKALTINENGNVGIGKEADFDPAHMLHLQSKGSVILRMEADKDNDTTTEDYNPMIWMTQDGMTANNDYFKIGMGGEDDSIFPDFKRNSSFLHAGAKFQIATGHPGAARLTIDETGNLGIGSNEPKSKLHIEDKTIDNTFLTIVGKAGQNTGIKLARGLGNKKGPNLTDSEDDNNNFTIQLSDQGLNFGVSDSLENNGSSDKFLILSNDKKVGIGTLEPARELTVKCGSNSGVVGIGDKLNGTYGGKRPGIYFAKDSNALNDMSYPNIYTFRPNEEDQQLYYKHNEHLFFVNNDFKEGTTTQTYTGGWNDGVQKFGLGVLRKGNVRIGTRDMTDDNTKLQIFTDSQSPSTDFYSGGSTTKNECLRLTGRAVDDGGAFIRFTNNIERGLWSADDSRYNKYTGGESAPAVGDFLSYNIAGIHGYDPNCDCWSGNLGFYTSRGGTNTIGTQLTESMTIQGTTGNVGIGTTDPVASLVVKESSRGGVVALGDKDVPFLNTLTGETKTSTFQRPGIYFESSVDALTNRTQPNIYDYKPGTSDATLYYLENGHFFKSKNSSTSFMRISENGVSIKSDHATDVSLDVNGTDAIRLPVGTTAQRPTISDDDKRDGLIRYNSDLNQYEVSFGTSWSKLAIDDTDGSGGGSLAAAFSAISVNSSNISVAKSAADTAQTTANAAQTAANAAQTTANAAQTAANAAQTAANAAQTAANTALSAEETARTTADTALSDRLDILEGDPTTQSALTAEQTARTNADTALSNRLDTLENAAAAAAPSTSTALSNRITILESAKTVVSATEPGDGDSFPQGTIWILYNTSTGVGFAGVTKKIYVQVDTGNAANWEQFI